VLLIIIRPNLVIYLKYINKSENAAKMKQCNKILFVTIYCNRV